MRLEDCDVSRDDDGDPGSQAVRHTTGVLRERNSDAQLLDSVRCHPAHHHKTGTRSKRDCDLKKGNLIPDEVRRFLKKNETEPTSDLQFTQVSQ